MIIVEFLKIHSRLPSTSHNCWGVNWHNFSTVFTEIIVSRAMQLANPLSSKGHPCTFLFRLKAHHGRSNNLLLPGTVLFWNRVGNHYGMHNTFLLSRVQGRWNNFCCSQFIFLLLCKQKKPPIHCLTKEQNGYLFSA